MKSKINSIDRALIYDFFAITISSAFRDLRLH